MQNYFYSFLFFSPFVSLIFAGSIILIILILITYFYINKTIVSLITFNLNAKPYYIINLLNKPDNYQVWWDKFNKNTRFQTDCSCIADSTLTNAKVTLKISSNNSNETWQIIIKQNSTESSELIIMQDVVIYSAIIRILKSLFFYNHSVLCLKNSLQKALKDLS